MQIMSSLMLIVAKLHARHTLLPEAIPNLNLPHTQQRS